MSTEEQPTAVNSWAVDVGYGFNAHGYLVDPVDALAGALTGWVAGELGTDPDGAAGGQLVLRRPDGTEVGHVALPDRLLHELKNALHRDYAAGQAGRRTEARRQEMTAVIVAARREYRVSDLGNLVAYALHDAAQRVYLGAVRLVHGRPGSWEAEIVMRMAEVGGIIPPTGSWERLSDLFREMGNAQDDGGQVLSDAFGEAARELGSLRLLAEGSAWAADVWNLANARNHDDKWEPWS